MGVEQQDDLQLILAMARDPANLLLGISFFEFQVRYDKGGSEMAFGLFGLGDHSYGSISIKNSTFPVWCLAPMSKNEDVEQCGLVEGGVNYVFDGGA